VRLAQHNFDSLMLATPSTPRRVLFLCSHNSARSQLAAALWKSHTGVSATSAGTHPAARVHRGAISAAKRAGLDITKAAPKILGPIPRATQVITVCDRVHEELKPEDSWWHWSIADPVDEGTPAAFDAVVAELGKRIAAITLPTLHQELKANRHEKGNP
jgi:protein-tyrosine-phosphatase